MAANTLAMRFPGGTVSAGFFVAATAGALVVGAFEALVVRAAATFCVAGAGAAACVESSRAAGAVCGTADDVGAGLTAFVATAATLVADAGGVVAVPVAAVAVAPDAFATELSAFPGFVGAACFALAARAEVGGAFGVRTMTMPVAMPRLNPNAATNGINRRFIMIPAACNE
jgi:hypothetical protein